MTRRVFSERMARGLPVHGRLGDRMPEFGQHCIIVLDHRGLLLTEQP